jgi:HAD superfamily hydrolase (TIGR01509 family)
MDLQAVLFDMDGTLVDSEKVWDVGLRELAIRYGGELSAPARTRMVGTSMAESMAILHADLGQPWRDPIDSELWLVRRVRDLFAEGLIWRPGARRLLAEVRAAGVPTALVTSTGRELVDVALATIGADNFDAVVCGDDVDENKPHPEPYRTAAGLLGVEVVGCVAIEDSPTGIRSALAAGCHVVAVPSEVDLSDVDGVIVVASLDELELASLRRIVAGDGHRPPPATSPYS